LENRSHIGHIETWSYWKEGRQGREGERGGGRVPSHSYPTSSLENSS